VNVHRRAPTGGFNGICRLLAQFAAAAKPEIQGFLRKATFVITEKFSVITGKEMARSAEIPGRAESDAAQRHPAAKL
jgi:hypothetical protein